MDRITLNSSFRPFMINKRIFLMCIFDLFDRSSSFSALSYTLYDLIWSIKIILCYQFNILLKSDSSDTFPWNSRWNSGNFSYSWLVVLPATHWISWYSILDVFTFHHKTSFQKILLNNIQSGNSQLQMLCYKKFCMMI